MRFITYCSIILILLVSFDSGTKFQVDDCLFKDKIQYTIIEIIDGDYIVRSKNTVTMIPKRIIETEFIRGTCQ